MEWNIGDALGVLIGGIFGWPIALGILGLFLRLGNWLDDRERKSRGPGVSLPWTDPRSDCYFRGRTLWGDGVDGVRADTHGPY